MSILLTLFFIVTFAIAFTLIFTANEAWSLALTCLTITIVSAIGIVSVYITKTPCNSITKPTQIDYLVVGNLAENLPLSEYFTFKDNNLDYKKWLPDQKIASVQYHVSDFSLKETPTDQKPRVEIIEKYKKDTAKVFWLFDTSETTSVSTTITVFVPEGTLGK